MSCCKKVKPIVQDLRDNFAGPTACIVSYSGAVAVSCPYEEYNRLHLAAHQGVGRRVWQVALPLSWGECCFGDQPKIARYKGDFPVDDGVFNELEVALQLPNCHRPRRGGPARGLGGPRGVGEACGLCFGDPCGRLVPDLLNNSAT